jgi:hypothetical protein
MKNAKSQSGFDLSFVRPLLDTLSQVLPSLERLVKACHDFLPAPGTNNKPSACNSCPNKETCKELCDDVVKLCQKLITHEDARNSQDSIPIPSRK